MALSAFQRSLSISASRLGELNLPDVSSSGSPHNSIDGEAMFLVDMGLGSYSILYGIDGPIKCTFGSTKREIREWNEAGIVGGRGVITDDLCGFDTLAGGFNAPDIGTKVAMKRH